MKVFTSKSQQLGKVGEDLASRYLVQNGYTIVEENHTRRWGEIDTIAKKGDTLYFVEVKSVSRSDLERPDWEAEGIRPEENFHATKASRFSRTVQTYLMNHPEAGKWQVALIVVYLDMEHKKARIKMYDNVIL